MATTQQIDEFAQRVIDMEPAQQLEIALKLIRKGDPGLASVVAEMAAMKLKIQEATLAIQQITLETRGGE